MSARLRYGGGLLLHTAASGAIGHLEELYLLVETDGATGLGAVRTNIGYLNGLAAEAVVAEAAAVVAGIEWRRGASELLAAAAASARTWSAPVRMLVDTALHDLAAQQSGVSVAAMLSGRAGAEATLHATNQTLFWSSDEEFLARAEAYVARGFLDLKVRVAAGAFAADVQRVAALRERFGPAVRIAIDANGAWDATAALRHLEALAPFDIVYAEQPVAAGDWASALALADRSPIPIMLDESVASTDDLARIADAGGKLLAHLKLVKLGGIGPTLAAARMLARAGVRLMIGQMNEGAAATAAALHTAVAASPAFAELYGADGIVDDPATGIAYGSGVVSIPAGPGLGLGFAPERANLIQEYRS